MKPLVAAVAVLVALATGAPANAQVGNANGYLCTVPLLRIQTWHAGNTFLQTKSLLLSLPALFMQSGSKI